MICTVISPVRNFILKRFIIYYNRFPIFCKGRRNKYSKKCVIADKLNIILVFFFKKTIIPAEYLFHRRYTKTYDMENEDIDWFLHLRKEEILVYWQFSLLHDSGFDNVQKDLSGETLPILSIQLMIQAFSCRENNDCSDRHRTGKKNKYGLPSAGNGFVCHIPTMRRA